MNQKMKLVAMAAVTSFSTAALAIPFEAQVKVAPEASVKFNNKMPSTTFKAGSPIKVMEGQQKGTNLNTKSIEIDVPGTLQITKGAAAVNKPVERAPLNQCGDAEVQLAVEGTDVSVAEAKQLAADGAINYSNMGCESKSPDAFRNMKVKPRQTAFVVARYINGKNFKTIKGYEARKLVVAEGLAAAKRQAGDMEATTANQEEAADHLMNGGCNIFFGAPQSLAGAPAGETIH